MAKAKRITFAVDEELDHALRDLASVQTGGNVSRMVSMVLRQNILPQGYEYHRMQEEKLMKRLAAEREQA